MIPLVHLPDVALVVVDVVAWAAFHSVTGYAVAPRPAAVVRARHLAHPAAQLGARR